MEDSAGLVCGKCSTHDDFFFIIIMMENDLFLFASDVLKTAMEDYIKKFLAVTLKPWSISSGKEVKM